jgi:capsular exopolysaccharide synthesis family protein
MRHPEEERRSSSGRRLADSAAGHVETILAAAAEAAEGFRHQAEELARREADATRRSAEVDATRIRQEASNWATKYREDTKRRLDELKAQRAAEITSMRAGYHSSEPEIGLNGSSLNGHASGGKMEQHSGSNEALSEDGGINLEHVLGTLRRRWWVIVLLAVVGAVAGYGISKVQQKQYTATSSVLFQTPPLSQQAYGVNSNPDTPSLDPSLMATDLQLLLDETRLPGATAQTVGHGVTANQVAQAISVSQEGQTTVADIAATTGSPTLSAAIANAYARQFVKTAHAKSGAQALQALKYVERQIKALTPAELDSTNGQNLLQDAASLRLLSKLQNAAVELVGTASAPTAPSSPKTKLNTGLGLVIGLLLGISLAFLLERFDRRIKNVAQLEDTYQLPLLATVPQRRVYSVPPKSGAKAQKGEREVFRLLHAYLRYFNVDRHLHRLMVSSAAPGDGKSTIARNLAQAAQETGTKTLLIEADLRLPDMARHYGIQASPGLSELLVDEATLEDAIRSIPVAARLNGSGEASLDVLVAGTPPPNPAVLIESRAMGDLLSWAGENYELVIVDTPPLSVVSDAMSLIHRVDGVIVVSQLGKNTRDAARFLRERLGGMHAPLLGVVANGVKGRAAAGYGYGYGYGHGSYGQPPEPVSTSAE